MAGSVRSDSRIKTKVLVKDMIAEVLPSESAVKRADEKMYKNKHKKFLRLILHNAIIIIQRRYSRT